MTETEKAVIYGHQSLDPHSREFRLLTVLPGGEEDEIHCNIRKANFDEEPVYTALSYSWNSSYDEEMAFVVCSEKLVPVGNNLWDFLHEFRRRATPGVFLWIDAICIDQSNVQERNHQVAQMCDIYSKASSVIVWLGESLDDEWLAFDGMVESPRRLICRDGDGLHYQRSPKPWAAFTALLNKPYWERVWIIQEFLLARTVNIWCGSHAAEWKAFEHIFESLKELSWKPHPPSESVLKSRGCVLWRQRIQWWRRQATPSRTSDFQLLEMVQVYATSKSTDVRDKVYSLLGLAEDSRIKADYSKSNIEVLVDVVREHCRWKFTSEIEASRSIVKTLRDILQVPSAELAWYICEHAPDLQNLLRFPANEERVYAPLRCIGVILSLECDVQPEVLTSVETLDDSPLRWSHNHVRQDSRTFLKSQSSSYEAIAVLAKLRESCDADDVLDIDLNRYTHCTLIPSRPGNAVAKVLQQEGPDTIHQECSSSDKNPRDVSSITARRTADSARVFVATNGVLGLTHSFTARPGDIVCVFEDAGSSDIAVILRQAARVQEYSYGVLGTARYATLGDDPLDELHGSTLENGRAVTPSKRLLRIPCPTIEQSDSDSVSPSLADAGGRTSLPSSAFAPKLLQSLSPSRDHGQTMEDRWVGTKLHFYCHPTLLPELSRHHMTRTVYVPQD